MIVLSALPTSERTVLVTLSQIPLAQSSIGSGDALNPNTWEIVETDTGVALIVLQVRQVSAVQYELYTLQLFAPFEIFMNVAAPTLLQSDGTTPISNPNNANFYGCKFAPQASTPAAPVDLLNVPGSPDKLSGTLQVGSSGDYLNMSGDDQLRKLVIRRIITVPGEFFYLDPSVYGVGLRLKQPMTVPDLISTKVSLQRQLQQEPDIESAQVLLTMQASGVLFINVKVKSFPSGALREVSFSVPQGFSP